MGMTAVLNDDLDDFCFLFTPKIRSGLYLIFTTMFRLACI